MVHFRPWLGVAVHFVFFVYPVHGLAFTNPGKMSFYKYCTVISVPGNCVPVSSWASHKGDNFGLVASSFRCLAFRFRTGLVKATCSPLEELFEEVLFDFLFLGFLSPYLRLKLSSSMVPRTVGNSSGPLINLSRAFLTLIVAATLYLMISSGVIWLNSHFLSFSTSLF